LAWFEDVYASSGETFFEQVITIANVFVTGEIEEMIGDAAAG
jgi:hypothetical protein